MPVLSSQTPTFMQILLNKYLDALTVRPAAGLLVSPKIKLFTAGPLPIVPTNVPTDFTEATFDGYGPVALVLSGPVNLPGGDGMGVSGTGSFVVATGTTPETIVGYYIHDDGNATLACAEYFDVPVPMLNPFDFIDLTVFLAAAFSISTGA